MLRLFHWHKVSWKPSKPSHVGVHLIALAEYSHSCTHVTGFQAFLLGLLHHFVLAKLTTSSISVFYLYLIVLMIVPGPYRPILAYRSSWGVSSGYVKPLKITSQWSTNLKNIWRRVVAKVIMNKSHTNIS